MFFHQLKGELWKLFGKKRTYIGFGMFLLAELAIILISRSTVPQRAILRLIERNGFDATKYMSTLTMAVTIMTPLAYTLLPLYVALVGGDLMSKEAEDGTLRMILSRPISRLQLVLVKWVSGLIFSFALVAILGLFGMACCSIWFPTDGALFATFPDQPLGVFEAREGLWHYVLAVAFMATKSSTIMSLAFMFSCFNMKPAAATILALSLTFIDFILVNIPYFADLKQYFLGHYLNTWQVFFADPIAWWRVGQAGCVLGGCSLTFLIIGAAVFQTRDIKS